MLIQCICCNKSYFCFSEEKDEANENTEAEKESKKKKKRKRRKSKKPQIESGMDSQDSGIVSQVEISDHKNTSGEKERVESKCSDERDMESDNVKETTEHPVENLKTEPNSLKHSKKRKAEENFENADLYSNAEVNIEESSKRKKKKSMSEENVDKDDLNNDTEEESHKHRKQLSGIEMSKEENLKRKKKNKREGNVDKKNLDDDTKHERHVNSVESTDEKFEKTNAGQDVDKIDKGNMKKKKKNKNKEGQKLQMSEERLKAYGINPKRYKYMKKEELFQIKPRKNAKKSDKETGHSYEIE